MYHKHKSWGGNLESSAVKTGELEHSSAHLAGFWEQGAAGVTCLEGAQCHCSQPVLKQLTMHPKHSPVRGAHGTSAQAYLRK